MCFSYGWRTGAFTLVELLIVIAIMAVLMSILVPALGHAREQARIAKCMSNQRSLVQGVQMFAVDHQGYGQVMADRLDWQRIGLRRDRYEYEVWPTALETVSEGAVYASPWPIAYGAYIGAPGMKSQDFFSPYFMDPRLALAKRPVGVLRCPSDHSLVADVLKPAHALGVISYNINTDVFGQDRGSAPNYKTVWRDGGRGGERLQGRLSGVKQPSEVALFVDGGGSIDGPLYQMHRIIRSGGGPTLSLAARSGFYVAPIERHGRNGRVVASYLDGHARPHRPVAWETIDGRRSPTRYVPDPRITPYDPGNYSSGNNYPDDAPRAR